MGILHQILCATESAGNLLLVTCSTVYSACDSVAYKIQCKFPTGRLFWPMSQELTEKDLKTGIKWRLWMPIFLTIFWIQIISTDFKLGDLRTSGLPIPAHWWQHCVSKDHNKFMCLFTKAKSGSSMLNVYFLMYIVFAVIFTIYCYAKI